MLFIILYSLEFREDDARGNAHVQGFRRIGAECKARDGYFSGNKPFDFGADTVSLVSHHDESFCPKICTVDVLTFQERPVAGEILIHEPRDKFNKIQVEHVHPENCTHTGLNGFWIKNVRTIVVTKYIANADPVA